MAGDITVAGTTMAMEFHRYGLMPVQLLAIQKWSQALLQFSSVGSCGTPISEPAMISAVGLNEFSNTTASGTRKPIESTTRTR